MASLLPASSTTNNAHVADVTVDSNAVATTVEDAATVAADTTAVVATTTVVAVPTRTQTAAAAAAATTIATRMTNDETNRGPMGGLGAVSGRVARGGVRN